MKKLGPKADPRKGGSTKKKGTKRAWGYRDHRTKEERPKQGEAE